MRNVVVRQTFTTEWQTKLHVYMYLSYLSAFGHILYILAALCRVVAVKYQLYSGVVCCKISELLEKTDSLHEQALSRQHEVKDVLSSLESFIARAESVSAKLTAFDEDVCKHSEKPLSADVDIIKADLQLIKVITDLSGFTPYWLYWLCIDL